MTATDYEIILLDEVSPAENWLREFTEPHWADVPALFVGIPVSFAAGGYLGMFVYGAGYVVTRVMVMTPLAKAISCWAAERLTERFGRRMIDANFRPYSPASTPTKETAIRSQHLGLEGVDAAFDDDALPYRGDGSEPLPVDEFIGRQIVIFGPTGVGKSSVIDVIINHIHRALPGAKFLIFDPHYEPGRKPSWVTVAGKGRNYDEVTYVLELALEEMTRRYRLLSEGKGTLDPLYVIVDELSTLADEIPTTVTNLLKLAREGRKVNLFTILTPHSPLVADMGMDGRGKSRQNYIFIGIPAKYMMESYRHKPRIVNVTIGVPNDVESLKLGKFSVGTPGVYVREPNFSIGALFRFFQRQFEQRMTVAGSVAEGVVRRAPNMSEDVAQSVAESQPQATTAQPRAFERLADLKTDLKQMAEYLVLQGFGTRKVGSFLPISDHDGRDLARQVMVATQPGLRPMANTDAERDLVLHLTRRYGAPAHRIARLLDGNDQVSLERVNRYLKGS